MFKILTKFDKIQTFNAYEKPKIKFATYLTHSKYFYQYLMKKLKILNT